MKTLQLLIIGLLVILAQHQPVLAATTAYPPDVNLETVKERIASASPRHPRLLVKPTQLEKLKESIPAGSLKERVAERVVREADEFLDVEPVTRTLRGRRLLHQSRECLERVLVLATAYHLTGQNKYVERCEREMLAAAAFEDWNPNHFLDVAEMTLALAIGYDWLFDELDPTSKKGIRTAIVEKSLKLPFETRHDGWVRARNNWGQVCHGGLTAGALAVMEEEPDLAAKTIHNALENVTLSMEAYAPKGSYPEGPSYWGYGTTYNVILIAVLNSVLDTDFGLSDAPGFDQTGQYPALVTGPSGQTFNYADGGSGRGPQPALYWFAEHYDRYDWLHGEFDILENKLSRSGRFLPLTLLWMDESRRPKEIDMPLHWFGAGSVPISIHRSSWDPETAVFIGFKGGSPSANHGQMDIGSFVLDADGVRWAMDLGAEGYHGIESRGMNLWDRSQDSDRWTIFRQMNHGHNTLVIDGQLQRAAGFGTFEHFSDDSGFPHSIIDMSAVYNGQAESVRRGMALLAPGCILIQDELKGLARGANVQWGMITAAHAGQAGSAELQLRRKDETLTLSILSPSDAVWSITDISKPRNEWDSPNPGATRVNFQVTAPKEGDLTLRVLAKPGSADLKNRDDYRNPVPLDQWGK